MTNDASRWLRAFPRAWRARYGEELAALVEDLEGDDDLRAVDRLDLLRTGLQARGRARRARGAVLVGASGIVTLAGVLAGLAFSGAFTSSPRSPSSSPVAATGAGCTVELDARTGAILRMQGSCLRRGGTVVGHVTPSGGLLTCTVAPSAHAPSALRPAHEGTRAIVDCRST